MTLKRYLLYFSYIGKQFSGLQRQVPRERPNHHDVTTVQGLLEYGLYRLHPENEVAVFPSSRTDQGVHALKTSAHVDLAFQWDFDGEYLVHALNTFFSQTGVDIRVLNAIEVSPHFHCRHLPQWRQYLYRFAVLNNANLLSEKRQSKFVTPLPITEAFRCHFVFDPKWDADAARKATSIFVGTQDYRTFMAKSRGNSPNIKTERNIFSCELLPGKPFLPSQTTNDWTFWQVRIRGKSFLYKMVRRMVSTLLALGGRKITGADIRFMLENPDQENWPSIISTIPGYGLYLEDIYYDPKDYHIGAPLEAPENEQADNDE